jgi:hypothetical protein
MGGISICISPGHMTGIAATGQPAVVISATSPPSLAAPAENQSAVEILTPGLYTVSEGTITGQTAEASINGAAFSAADMTTPLAALDTLVVRELVSASGGQTAYFPTQTVSVAAVAPVVTVSIEQGAAEVGAVLGTDLTARTEIVEPGSPALTAGDIALGWRVDGADAPAGNLLDFGDSVVAVASWGHASGAGTVLSDALTVPLAQAPELSVAFAQGSYAAGAILTESDILPQIPASGYPALAAGDVVVTLEANGVSAALPYTAQDGDVLTPLATAQHVTGPVSASGASVTVAAGFSISEDLGGTVLLDGVTGDLTITITEPAIYAGTYTRDVDGRTLNTANMAGGPQCFFPPAIEGDGSPAAGEILTSRNGLWIYDADQPVPVRTTVWQGSADGLSGWADIAGATAETHTIAAEDAGRFLRKQETLTQTGTGSRSAASNTAEVAAAPATGLQVGHVASGGVDALNTGSGTIAGLSLPAPEAGREFIALVAWRPQGGENDLASVTLAGVPGTSLAAKVGTNEGNVFLQAFSFAVPSGTIGDAVVTTSAGNMQDIHVHLFRATGWQFIAQTGVAPVSPPADTPIAHDIDIAAGQVLIAGAIARGNGSTVGAPSGYSLDASLEPAAGRFSVAGHHDAIASQTPRAVSTTWQNAVNEAACLSLVIGAAS